MICKGINQIMSLSCSKCSNSCLQCFNIQIPYFGLQGPACSGSCLLFFHHNLLTVSPFLHFDQAPQVFLLFLQYTISFLHQDFCNYCHLHLEWSSYRLWMVDSFFHHSVKRPVLLVFNMLLSSCMIFRKGSRDI